MSVNEQIHEHPHEHLSQGTRAYIGLLLITVCIYILFYCPQSLLHTISQEFGSSMAATSFLIGVFMLSMCISPLFVGMLLDKTGVKNALVACGVIFTLSGVPILFCSSYASLMAVRAFQALVTPVALTAIMSSVSNIFRHMDISRAMAGYIACNLVGSLSGRILGGWCGEFFGWRVTLASVSLLFLAAVLLLAFNLKDPPHHHGRLHSLREYASVFKIPCVGSLLYAEACGLFVFGGLGNLIPFRMAELGAGHSEGRIALMYLGYMVGIFVSLVIGRLIRLVGGPMRLLLLGGALYAAFFLLMYFPSQPVLFGTIWSLALAQYFIHAIAPGFINRQTFGICDRSIVNALYLSCYYIGGVLGSVVPVSIYSAFGWTAAYGCMELVLLSSFLVILRLHRGHPEFNAHA